MEPLTRRNHLGPHALTMSSGDPFPAAPAVVEATEARDSEPVAHERAEQPTLPLELVDRGVERLEDQLAAAPGRAAAAAERFRDVRDFEGCEDVCRRPH